MVGGRAQTLQRPNHRRKRFDGNLITFHSNRFHQEKRDGYRDQDSDLVNACRRHSDGRHPLPVAHVNRHVSFCKTVRLPALRFGADPFWRNHLCLECVDVYVYRQGNASTLCPAEGTCGQGAIPVCKKSDLCIRNHRAGRRSYLAAEFSADHLHGSHDIVFAPLGRLLRRAGFEKEIRTIVRSLLCFGPSLVSETTNPKRQDEEEAPMKAIYNRAAPYADDAMNLPVADVDAAIPYYEKTFGFRVVTRKESPHKSVTLARDAIQIGLAENGGDPTQEGCFFEVDNVEAAFEEIRGKPPAEADLRIDKHGDSALRVFFEVAPDGLCYMIGERQE